MLSLTNTYISRVSTYRVHTQGFAQWVHTQGLAHRVHTPRDSHLYGSHLGVCRWFVQMGLHLRARTYGLNKQGSYTGVCTYKVCIDGFTPRGSHMGLHSTQVSHITQGSNVITWGLHVISSHVITQANSHFITQGLHVISSYVLTQGSHVISLHIITQGSHVISIQGLDASRVAHNGVHIIILRTLIQIPIQFCIWVSNKWFANRSSHTKAYLQGFTCKGVYTCRGSTCMGVHTT